MKVTISIFCTVMLSLVAVRANAQFGSGAQAALYCGPVTESCTDNYDPRMGCNEWGAGSSATIQFNGTFSLNNGSGYPYMDIDWADSEINLSFYVFYGNTDTNTSFSLTFSPIPFHYLNGKLEIIPGQYASGYRFSSESGQCGCSVQGDVTDSVRLVVSPSDLVTFGNLRNVETIAFSYSDGIELLKFPPSPNNQVLKIANILGVEIARRFIASMRNSEVLNLPPGLYFARLGDQVAKFIVPPR